jgi:hypothetical protein
MAKQLLCLGVRNKPLTNALKRVGNKFDVEWFLVVGLSSKHALGFVVSDVNPHIYLAENYGTIKSPAITINEKLMGLPKGLLKKLQNRMKSNLEHYTTQLSRLKKDTSPIILQCMQNFLNKL